MVFYIKFEVCPFVGAKADEILESRHRSGPKCLMVTSEENLSRVWAASVGTSKEMPFWRGLRTRERKERFVLNKFNLITAMPREINLF